MQENNKKTIIRHYVGEIPLLQAMADKLQLREVLSLYIDRHGNEKISAVDTLMLLLFNMASGRYPLYELQQWVGKLDSRMFSFDNADADLFSDDRFARALDKLYQVDRATLTTHIAMHTVNSLGLNMNQIHNDSTTIKAHGQIKGITDSGFQLCKGNSKDHRPDLKQLVYSLTISNDGAVPVHYKAYSGNRTDDTTHIETWDNMRQIIGRPDFLYVADCKVCTDAQLFHITEKNGRVVTVVPETWSEVRDFKDELRLKNKPAKLMLRRPIPGQLDKYESFHRYTEECKTQKRNYTIYWIRSSEKKKQDYHRRDKRLIRTEDAFTELLPKLNKRKLKSEEQITASVDAILKRYKTKPFYIINLTRKLVSYRKQKGKGRPGSNTEYFIEAVPEYRLSWQRNKEALKQEKNVDGIFPLLCTDEKMTAKQTFDAYKYQPRLEKRFTQFKSIHNGAPLLFKKIERVEAIMFIFFLCLILQAAIEREVRKQMKKEDLKNIAVYPEHRLAYHPTTAKIFDRFAELSTYQLSENGCVLEEYRDQLEQVHMQILNLLHINVEQFWPESVNT